MKSILSAAALCAALVALATPVTAQSRARLFGLELGIPISELPLDEWVDPACGTNGGPASIVLASFDEFARCRPETQTGLHEVWFIYDDEWEYIARAYRVPEEIQSFAANVFYRQPIITSLLIDASGLVQGYRIVTDPRAETDIRREAYTLQPIFRDLYRGGSWTCVDLPAAERENPVEGRFIKSSCVSVTDDLYIRTDGRFFAKAGQAERDVPGLEKSAQGDFESIATLEVFARDAVAEAPCCSEAIAAASQ